VGVKVGKSITPTFEHPFTTPRESTEPELSFSSVNKYIVYNIPYQEEEVSHFLYYILDERLLHYEMDVRLASLLHREMVMSAR
jgi:hypothetical protein